ncbi:MAG: hypothetical protein JWL86_6051 [Rhizobium sp.]|nr:hypothetical protein [Rhizobium sp.]
MNSHFREQLGYTKVLCLSARPNSTLMWSHYADAHRGVVLRFRSIPAFDSQFGVARPVNYVQEVPLFNTEDEIIEFMGGGSVPAPATLADRFILTKHISWSYENEWRLQAGHGRDKTAKFEDVGFGRNELDGIIFGLNASSDDQRAIVSLAKAYPNATLFKSVKVGTSFDLMIKEVTSDLF